MDRKRLRELAGLPPETIEPLIEGTEIMEDLNEENVRRALGNFLIQVNKINGGLISAKRSMAIPPGLEDAMTAVAKELDAFINNPQMQRRTSNFDPNRTIRH